MRPNCVRVWSPAPAALAVVLAAPLLVVATAASGQSAPVLNRSPQKTVDPPEQVRPLYYPLRAKDLSGDGEPPAGSPENVLWRVRELHSTRREVEALVAVEELVAMIPDRPISHYNHACVLARLRRIDPALDALERAVERGWRNLDHLLLDPDLAPLRSAPRFARVVQRLRELRRDERLSPRPLRTEPWPEIADEVRSVAPVILERYRIAGAALALVRDGRVVWSEGFGVDDPRVGRPIDHRSRFRVTAPLDLLALMASYRQEDEGALEVSRLIAHGRAASTWRDRGLPARTLFVDDPNLVAPALPSEARGRISVRRHGQPSLEADDTLGLLRLAVEITSNEAFPAYCRRHLLEPAGAQATSLDGLGDGEAEIVLGHTPLGTPVADEPGPGTLVTTAADLARVLMRSDRTVQGLVSGDGVTAAANATDLGSLGLRVRVAETRFGRRLEIADDRRPTGCLLQWYPEAGSGVVVLFNGQDGGEAARRLARTALGGE